MSKATAHRRQRAISWPVIVFLLVLIVAVLYWRGREYYPLGIEDRVYHGEHKSLRSSGFLGYGYGLLGTLLIFANLLYLGRRRFARWNLGSMRTWLDIHVFTGLSGAAFIAFHSTFQARSTIAKVTVLSLIVVIVSGLIGRFLFALVPKRDAEALDRSLADAGREVPGLDNQLRVVLEEHPVVRSRGGFVGALFAVARLRQVAAARREAVEVLAGNAGLGPEAIDQLAREICREPHVVARAQLLRTWRAMHRFFAILMLLTVVFHIAIAWYYGYRWVFSA